MSIAEVLRKEGKAEGKAEGVEIGTILGGIQDCQELLDRAISSTEELQLKSADELESLHRELKAEVRKRFKS